MRSARSSQTSELALSSCVRESSIRFGDLPLFSCPLCPAPAHASPVTPLLKAILQEMLLKRAGVTCTEMCSKAEIIRKSPSRIEQVRNPQRAWRWTAVSAVWVAAVVDVETFLSDGHSWYSVIDSQ